MRKLSRVLALLLIASLTACVVGPDNSEEEHELVPIDELGSPDPEGEPYAGDWKADVPLPDKVDHAPLLLPIRNQGRRGTCQAHALLAAIEGYHGLKEHLSVEHFVHIHRAAAVGIAYTLRFPGTKVVDESSWPYNTAEPANLASLPTTTMPKLISTGLREETLKKYLAESPRNNIAVGVAWDDSLPSDGFNFLNPQLDVTQALARRTSCNFRGLAGGECGGHMVLVVGYEQRMDSDGVKRTFFKIRNSWGTQWGERMTGYAFMSSEYLRQMGLAGFMLKQ